MDRPLPLEVANYGLGAAALACPSTANEWQTQQNGYCADEYGWPVRADGSSMTREDIEAAARAKAVKDYWPYAAGGLALVFLLMGRR